ncbi:deoxyuridine 5'-triphosphate nucleotidohydrolase [Candidatus Magnetomorum sp. HK-1]|nr:deoxyuridine 5'-triphosphate nucleotidohydrolase [Candidatus Magnetomorum sp. HK-1]
MVLNQESIREYIKQTPPLVEGMNDPDTQIQPNGVDMTLDKIFSFKGTGQIDFSNQKRVLPQKNVLEFDSNGCLNLKPGAYAVTFKEIVNLPDHLMALGRPRSSLIRMGASIITAVWDAGYSGRSEALLTVQHSEGVCIFENARLLQLVFFQLTGKTEGYNGIYQGENLS